MRTLTIFRKTVADLSNPKILAAYFVPYLTITGFLALAMGNNAISGSKAPLSTQVTELHGAFAGVSFFVFVGAPLLGLAGVFAALSVGTEAEAGTFQLLLSKPLRRWEYYVGTYCGVVGYALAVALTCLLLSAVLVVEFSGVHPAAIADGIFAQLLGTLTYALFGILVVSAVGFALAVTTKDRLRTALGTLTIPALHFAFLPIRAFSGQSYGDYALYLVDVNYHFGNAYVFINEMVGDLPVETQLSLLPWTGVYEEPSGSAEQLPETLDPIGHVPLELSVLLLAAIGIGAFLVGMIRFRAMDV